MLDYLVVGLGLAGISFCHTLERNGKSFHVISDTSQRSTWVAGGLYNPVILKRFKASWKAQDQMSQLGSFYASLEETLGTRLHHPVPVLRRFASVGEQNLWFEAADRPELSRFLDLKQIQNTNPNINAEYGFGRVIGTGRIDTKVLVEVFAKYLDNTGRLDRERVDFQKIELGEDYVSYGSLKARHMVFATGYGLLQNPYFNYLPIQGSKGELLTIKAPELAETNVIKSSVFIIPLGGDLYRVGATYNSKDKTNEPTTEAREELCRKLETFLKCEYQILDHIAGVRPTVSDRRPLVGRHPKNPRLYVLNGFGSRGVMIGPYASRCLYDYIENGIALAEDMDIQRFSKKYKDL